MKTRAIITVFLCLAMNLMAQTFMTNPYGCKNATLLNGRWNAIIDLYSRGEVMKFYQNRKPRKTPSSSSMHSTTASAWKCPETSIPKSPS